MAVEKQGLKHSRTSGIEAIYAVFLAILIALVVGLGVSAFYEYPKAPEYPITSNAVDLAGKESEPSKEQLTAQANYEKAMTEYQVVAASHNRNASMIVLGIAVIVLVIGLMFSDKIKILSNGLLLGGVFTLVYSIIRGLMTEDVKYQFIIALVGLAIVMVIGYIKFIRPDNKLSKS